MTKTIDLFNGSSFPVRYILKCSKRGHSNLGPIGAFDATPAEAVIPAGGVQRLTLRFSPDHAGLHFYEVYI